MQVMQSNNISDARTACRGQCSTTHRLACGHYVVTMTKCTCLSNCARGPPSDSPTSSFFTCQTCIMASFFYNLPDKYADAFFLLHSLHCHENNVKQQQIMRNELLEKFELREKLHVHCLRQQLIAQEEGGLPCLNIEANIQAAVNDLVGALEKARLEKKGNKESTEKVSIEMLQDLVAGVKI